MADVLRTAPVGGVRSAARCLIVAALLLGAPAALADDVLKKEMPGFANASQPDGVMVRRYKDMGDGTWAEVIYSGAVGGGPAVVAMSGKGAALTEKSGTITAGGTAQVLMAANAARTGCLIQNVSSGDLWFNSLATAVASQPSFRLEAGGSYMCPPTGVPLTAISIIGATTAQAFSAREW